MKAGKSRPAGVGKFKRWRGQMITTNPGEIHDGIPIQQHTRSWRMVFVTPESLAELVGQPAAELSRPVLDDAALHHAFDQLFRHWSAVPTADEQSILEELLTHACGSLVLRYSSKPLADVRYASLGRVRECLLDQMVCPPTLSKLAALAGLSRYQLVRHFSKAHGLPPFAWLQQHRVNRA